MGASPAAAAVPASLVSVCSGVSLPPSVVTNIIRPVLGGIVSPIQNTINPILRLPVIGGAVGLPQLNINVTGLLNTAAAGQPIRLSVLDTNGTILGPGAQCNSTADSIQLNAPAGISIGGNRITGLGANNQDATAGEINSIAFGNNASTAAAATSAVAIGNGASVTAANSVALGAGSTATRGANAGSVGEVSVGAPGATRQITNVAAGTAPTDAANVGQLVGATANAVQYDLLGGVKTNTITLSGGAAGPVTITNVAPGSLAAGSTDAVNGSQLGATNTNVATNTTNIAGNTTNITNLSNGTLGVVRQVNGAPGSGTITVGAETAGTVVDLTGTAGTRTLNGVTAGLVDPTSTQAINGAQLSATNTQVATNTTNITTNSNNIATNAGNIAANTTAIAGNTTSINALNNGTAGLVLQANGGAPGAGQITVGAATGGTSVSIAGTDGTRVLSGVSAGAATTDAVNVGQLNAVGAVAANAVAYDLDGAGNKTGTVTLSGVAGAPVIVTNVAPGALNATSTDAVNGAQLFATNGQVATNTGNIATNTANIAGNTTAIATNTTNIAGNTASITANTNLIAGNTTSINALNNGTAGLVQQSGGGAPGNGQITVGAATGGTSISVAAQGGGTRTITGVTAGVAATDAVNVSQLGAVSAVAANAVTYDLDALGNRTNSVTLAGGLPGPVVVTNVAPGALNATSVDAVNGAQLFATNGLVATNTTNIANNTLNIAGNTANIAANTTLISTNTVSITALNNGTAGLVQQVGGAPGNGLITVGALTGGTNVSFAALGGGTRVLSGVAAGVAATDAVNVSQLGAIGAVAANAVTYDLDALGNRTNTITLAGGAAGPVKVTNVADGTLAAGSTDAVNGAQLFATNGNVTNNTTAITNLTTNINNGTLGLVRQVGGSPGAGVVTVGAQTGGTVLNVAGTDGTRTVSGVSAGVATTDAVNVGQLNALGTTVANSVQYDTVGGVRTNTVTLAGGTAGPVTVTNVAAGALNAGSTDAVNGAQLFATNTQVATNTTNIAGNTTAITNLTTSINNGTTGLVQQTGGAPGNGQITVGANTGGTSVSVAGTGGNRVITGAAAGLAANDVATVGQLAQVTGGAFNAVNYDTDANGGRLNSVTLQGGTAAPVRIGNVANGTVAAGSLDAVNGGQLAATNANVASNTTAIANNTTAIANNTTTINAVVNGTVGTFRSNNAAGAAAPSATGANATAGGFGASASGARGLALGNSAVSTGTNSVSLGAGSSDGGVANVVSVGAVGAERRVTNVGPALNGTDAVNLSQLQAAQAQFGVTAGGLQSQINDLNFDLGRVRRNSNAATAGAMAVAALPQAFSPGAGMIGGGIGNWKGEYAFAIGASKIIGDQTVFKAGVSYNTRGSGGFNAGVGYQF